MFRDAFKASSFYTRRGFARIKIASEGEPQCGTTHLAAPQPLPEVVDFGFREGEGFIADHQGPCEIWCDDARVMADDNCAVTFKAKTYMEGPAKLAYDKAKCQGAKVMSFYWMLVILPREWPLYVNCAALAGVSGSSPTSAPSSMPPSARPSPAPAPSVATPRAGPAPAPSTTPQPGCVRRSRSRRS